MELKQQLLLQLLSQASWTDQRRRDLVASVLLILNPSFEVLDVGLKGVDALLSYRIDSKLISDLYASCTKDQKLALAHTAAFCRLDPPTFKRLFQNAWRLEPMKVVQRHELVLTLSAFLSTHPTEAETFREMILGALWSRHQDPTVMGIRLAGYLNDLAPRELERLKRMMTAAYAGFRMNAHNALCELVKRHRALAPEVLAFVTSDEVRRIARRVHRSDPDKDPRTCASYLLKALRAYDQTRR